MDARKDGDGEEDGRAEERERALGIKGAWRICIMCVGIAQTSDSHSLSFRSNQKKKQTINSSVPCHPIQFS